MRVLQLHNHHAGPGGAMEVLADEAAMLAGAGHDVDQYTLPATETMGLSGVRAGAKAVWNADASRELARRIAKFSPDVVHVHTPFPLMSPVVFRTATHLGLPTVATVHSFRYSCIVGTCHRDGHICEDCVGTRFKLSGVRHRCYHNSVGASAALTLSLVLHRSIGTLDRAVTRFITLTDFAKELLVRDGIPPGHIIVKANSVPDPGEPDTDHGEPGVGHANPYVTFVGRLLDVKGVRTLLDAWKSLPTDMRLCIAGDGPLRQLVQDRAAADPRIDYLGWIGQDEVSTLMARATAVVVPSEWYEGGVPLVVLRSLAAGTPVIVSDLDNICAPVVSDDSGVAFATGDAAALTAVVQSLTDDRADWLARRATARASYLQRFTPAINVNALVSIYREVCR